VLELKDVSLAIGPEEDARTLLSEVTLQLPQGHFCAIVGPSGCGKSTLLKIIAGLREPTSGSVHWEGRDLAEEEDLHPSDIGYVPQFSIAYDHLTVRESVETALRLRVAGLSGEEREDRADEILKEVGLEAIADRFVKVLSGGQRRRLALAVEMVTSPALLLADEVTSGLDPKAEEEIVHLLREIANQDNRTVLCVTHSLRHLALYDSVLVLHEGHVVYHGPSRHLLHYFDIESPEDVFPRLTNRTPQGWHKSWQKHRTSYYETDRMPLAGAKPVDFSARSKSPQISPDPARKRTVEIPKSLRDVDDDDEEDDDSAEDSGDRRTGPARKSEESERRKSGGAEEDVHSEAVLPGVASQFFTLLGRRWKLFFRDRGQLLLQIALILGFPCLVVIFAWDGLPNIRNLDMVGGTLNPMEQAAEALDFVKQSSQIGGLVSGIVMFQVILLTLMGANNGAREIASERLIYEKERLGGVRPAAYVASKAAFLFVLVAVQSAWMALFVKFICRMPGSIESQLLLLLLCNGAMTAVCLGISSLMRSAEQASLVSIYFVGFQLPLSGAVLALPGALEWMTRPFIAAYWGWSGMLKTMPESRYYEIVKSVIQTDLSSVPLSLWVLAFHILIGILIAYTGCKRSRWE
jgi:ABC-type multidrug transport system ATPase subunit